jgi:Arc/MetJ-type ribon-helix-helix transcriptional regulator
MEVTLTPYAEKLVCESIATGEFESPSDAVEAGLRLLLEFDDSFDTQRDALLKALKAASDRFERGEYHEYSDPDVLTREIMAEGRALKAERAGQKT